MTSDLIRFYRNEIPGNRKKDYYFKNILLWDDYDLEVKHDFIQLLFPDKTGGVNKDAFKLTDRDIEVFKTDTKIRNNVLRATIRMLNFYGFKLTKNMDLEQIKEIKRTEKGTVIGLHSIHNYRRLSRMMSFLVKINMKKLSAIVFLMICTALKKDAEFKRKVKMSNSLEIWLDTQKYLETYKKLVDINLIGKEEDSTDDDYMDEDEKSREEIEYDETRFQKICTKFKGLNYTGNSCYQDSVLLPLLAMPNRIIREQILEKNLSKIVYKDKKWISCGKNLEQDILIRQSIQKELQRITASMRNMEDNQTCSNLRKLFEKCPGSEAFHRKGMQDAGEFLLYLFNIFQTEVMLKHRVTYVTNDLESNDNLVKTFEETQVSSPVLSVSAHILQRYNREHPPSLRTFLSEQDDSVLSDRNLYKDFETGMTYRRRIEIIDVISTPYLVFNLQRLIQRHSRQEIRNNLPIHINETIVIGSKTLKLHAIVVHTGLHYTCYIKCVGSWFWYDDSPSKTSHIIKHIGDFQKMLTSEPNPAEKGILYFYS